MGICFSSSISDLKLNNLNIEIYHFYIFNYLHIKDIIKLRSVSKIFRSIVDSYEIKQLNFKSGIYVPNCDSDKEEIKIENYLASCGKLRFLLPFSKFDKVVESPILLNIKDLSIYGLMDSSEFEWVNKFIKLQRLKFDWIKMHCTDLSKHRLQLPDLKELYISLFWYRFEICFGLVIDTPNLQKLKIKSDCPIYKVEIIHPLSIKYFKINDYYYDHFSVLSNLSALSNLSVLSNLECLELYCCSTYKIEMLKEVPELKNLKKLIIKDLSSNYIYELKDLFVSKKDDLDIVLYGVKIKDTNQLNECIVKEELEFQLDNYGYLEDDLPLQEFDYIQLMNLIPKIPDDFFKKYSNIKIIKIKGEIHDENRLISFIKRCKKLYQLVITDARLSQQFYDQLPAICSLICLKIEDIEDFKITTKFAEKMPHLFDKDFYFYDTEKE